MVRNETSAWASFTIATPPSVDEPADLGDTAALLESLRSLREQLTQLEALCDIYHERAQAIPHRTKAIELELSLARRLITARRQWIDEVQRELGPTTTQETRAEG